MSDSGSNGQDMLRAVYAAIDEVNLQLPEDRRLRKAPETCLGGSSGNLDSLQLVSLIVSVEEQLETICHLTVSMSEKEDIFSVENSPLETVETLVRCLSSLCRIQSNV